MKSSGIYNPENTHVRQIKSGMDISDATGIKRSLVPLDSKVDKENSLDHAVVIEAPQTRGNPNGKERAQTAAKASQKPPRAG